jgi:hypothetical protein
VYGWIWQHLPGPTPVRLLIALVLIAGIVLLLFTVVFPWLEPLLPFTDVTVDDAGSAAGPLSPPSP